MLQLVPSKLFEIEDLRLAYLKSLPLFQDIFLEFMVKDSSFYKLFYKDNLAGYCIISGENILVEFYLIETFVAQSAEFLKAIISAKQVLKIYCKSFDFLLLNSCMLNKYNYKLIGCLYRDYLDTNFRELDDLTMSFATVNDLPFLYQQEDEVFEPKEFLETAIKNNGILLFRTTDVIVGCGFVTQIHPSRNFYDIGVWVDEEYRKRGIGTKIIRYLKRYCLRNNLKPVIGCDINNLASQKIIEKAGFISKHKLIEFKSEIE